MLPPPVPNPPPPATEAQIVILTSTSADGLRSRDFALKYWKPVTHDAPLRAALDLPESYFSPTASELQTAFAGQVKKREQLVDAPLLTRKLREKEELEKSRIKANRWPQVSSISLRTSRAEPKLTLGAFATRTDRRGFE